MKTFRDHLATALASAQCVQDALIFPTVLARWPRAALERVKSVTHADTAITYLARFGFEAERTRMNLYGYPGLFRELNEPPPWIEVSPEDCDNSVSPHRRAELEPLYIQAITRSDAELESDFEQHQIAKENAWAWMGTTELGFRQKLMAGVSSNSNDLEPYRRQMSLEAFRSKVRLARCLGRRDFEAVYDAIFDFDEFTPAAGAPDLFAWQPDQEMWFFAELKAPGDSLRQTQAEWVSSNWGRIKGRFVILQIMPTA